MINFINRCSCSQVVKALPFQGSIRRVQFPPAVPNDLSSSDHRESREQCLGLAVFEESSAEKDLGESTALADSVIGMVIPIIPKYVEFHLANATA